MSSLPVPRLLGSRSVLGRHRRRPSWLLRVCGVSLGGLAVGVAIGLVLPGQPI
ncbi:MAG: hypothetical protein ACQSGP_15645 [Frankia sp.]